MSTRTTDPSSTAADEPDPVPADDVVGVAPADPAHVVPTAHEAGDRPAGDTMPGPRATEPSVPASDDPSVTDRPSAADEPGTGDGFPAEEGAARGGTDLAVPEVPAPPAPVPAQDLAPAPPSAHRAVGPAAAIAAPAALDAAHDETPAPVPAGGSGSGSSAGAARAGGKGRRRPKKDPEGRMALREHLVELRKRVVRAGIFVLAGAIAGWFLYLPVITYMTAPLVALEESDPTSQIQINFSNVASSFDLQLKGAVWIGVIVSSPFWIYQLWAFITPGLTKKERRYAVGFVSAAVPLFLAGVYLASLFIPRAVEFFTSFTPESGSNIIDAPTYIGFVMRTVLTFGLAFLLPVVLVALNFAGLLSGKAILRAWRWVLVAALTFAAVATPTPDITAMFTLAAPIVVLFALAIVVCLVHDRRKAKRAPSYAGVDDDTATDLGDDEAAPL